MKYSFKLFHKVLVIEVVGVLVLLFFLSIFLPQFFYWNLKDTVLADAVSYNSLAKNQIDSFMALQETIVYQLNNDTYLNKLLNDYYEKKSDRAKAEINHYLGLNGIIDKENTTIWSISIRMNDGTVFASPVSSDLDIAQFAEEWFLDYQNGKYLRAYSNPIVLKWPLSSEIGETALGSCVYYASSIISSRYSGEYLFLCNFSIVGDAVQGFYENDVSFALLNRDNKVMLENHINMDEDLIAWLQDSTKGTMYRTLETSDTLYVLNYTNVGGWKLITRITQEELLRPYAAIFKFIQIVFLGGFLALMIIVLPMLYSINRPLGELARQIKRVASGDWKTKVSIRTSDEIAQVGHAFNRMTDQLEQTVNELLKQQEEQQRLRYSLLTSQIDPHFVYNTLNTVSHLARKGKNDDVVVVNNALIELLRDRLRLNKEEIADSIQHEIRMIDQYICIQQYRYGNQFEVDWQVDEELMSRNIPKGILQPLVENSIFHGLLPGKDSEGQILEGAILVTISTVGGKRIYIKVWDDGAGITPEYLADLNTGKMGNIQRGMHIGVGSIRQRLQYLYGEDYFMKYSSEQGKWCCVEIEFPVINIK